MNHKHLVHMYLSSMRMRWGNKEADDERGTEAAQPRRRKRYHSLLIPGS
jgi:hypothetical protein